MHMSQLYNSIIDHFRNNVQAPSSADNRSGHNTLSASMGNAMRRHCSKRNRHRYCKNFTVNNITPNLSRKNYFYTSENQTTTKPITTEEVINNASVSSSSSWITTLGTRSDFSLSLPTGESESSESEISARDSRDEIDSELHTSDEGDQRSRTVSSESIHSSDTSADFSSFKPLSQLSEHSMVRLRDEDIEWAEAVRRYHSAEPVFHKPAIKATLKIRPRRMKPQLSWRRCFHQWAVRQPPEEYRGKDVLNPFAPNHHRHPYEHICIAKEDDDRDRGIFCISSTKC